MEETYALELRDISKRFGSVQANDHVNLTLRKSEILAILGENGSGKTTLMNMIYGIYYPDEGHIFVNGKEVKIRSPKDSYELGIGMVHQHFKLVDVLTAAENIVLGLPGKARLNMKKITEDIQKLVNKYGFDLDLSKKIYEMSVSEKQTVEIVKMLYRGARILILDEPTSQLDPEGSDEVFRAVETLTGSGITILMIEQKIEKLAAYCDRILLLHKGKQIAFDTPQKVFSMPDLNDYGIQAPAFTRICKAEQVTLADGTYPVTVKEAAEVLREKRLGVYEHANAEAGVQKAVGASAAGTGQVQAKNAETGARSGQSGTCRKAENVASVDKQFRIEKLDFSYLADIPVLEDLNMKLDQRPTAIIGQNGAGKTTLVKLLKGLLKPVSGSIYFHGEDISGKTVAMLAGSVGYVFQNPDDQIFKYNVMDEVLFGPLNIGMDPEQAKKEAAWALELTGLSGKEKENPYDLELYERKMTAIASVLAMDTDVLILDEPTIAQDWKGRQIIGSIIRSLSGRGKLVIAILHDMDFVAENFERVIIMAHGQVLADGTAKEVFAQEEVLKKARLQKPYVMQLSEALGYEKSYLTVEELLKDRMSLCAAIKL